MIFRLTAKKKGMSTTELGAEVGVEQNSNWLCYESEYKWLLRQDG